MDVLFIRNFFCGSLEPWFTIVQKKTYVLKFRNEQTKYGGSK